MYLHIPVHGLSAAQFQKPNFSDSDPLATSLGFEVRPDAGYK